MFVKDMVNSERIRNSLRNHIQEQIDYFGGMLPERHAIAWGGYLAGQFIEGLLDVHHYTELTHMLPKVSGPDPVADLFIFEPDNPLLNA